MRTGTGLINVAHRVATQAGTHPGSAAHHRAASSGSGGAPPLSGGPAYLLTGSPIGDSPWILIALIALCAGGTALVVAAGGHRHRRQIQPSR